ncbi:MAG: hypothetical protein AAGI92_05890 [Pseudomonadota bacterium]
MTANSVPKLVGVCLLAFALAACGRAGSPEAPSASATTVDGEEKTEATAPDRPFILDALLN